MIAETTCITFTVMLGSGIILCLIVLNVLGISVMYILYYVHCDTQLLIFRFPGLCS